MLTLLALLAALFGPGPILDEATGAGPARMPVGAGGVIGGGQARNATTSGDVNGAGPVTLTDVNGSGPVTLHDVNGAGPVTLHDVNGAGPVTLTDK